MHTNMTKPKCKVIRMAVLLTSLAALERNKLYLYIYIYLSECVYIYIYCKK